MTVAAIEWGRVAVVAGLVAVFVIIAALTEPPPIRRRRRL